eukprot:5759528-Alexandrium_andersonii.AAC.1
MDADGGIWAGEEYVINVFRSPVQMVTPALRDCYQRHVAGVVSERLEVANRAEPLIDLRAWRRLIGKREAGAA